MGSEYPVQVGNQDFAIDLVFFHRGLTCLVAFELKVGKFAIRATEVYAIACFLYPFHGYPDGLLSKWTVRA